MKDCRRIAIAEEEEDKENTAEPAVLRAERIQAAKYDGSRDLQIEAHEEEARQLGAAHPREAGEQAGVNYAREAEQEIGKERGQANRAMPLARVADAAPILGGVVATQQRKRIARLPARPRGWKITHLGVSTRDAMAQFDFMIPRTITENRDAEWVRLRKKQMLPMFIAGRTLDCSRSGLVRQLGRHNKTLAMYSQLNRIQHTSEVIKAIRRISRVRAYKRSLANQNTCATRP